MSADRLQQFERVFQLQKSVFQKQMYTPYALRMDRLARVEAMLSKYRPEFIAAIEKDYGSRSALVSNQGEITICTNALRYMQKNLRKWMKIQKRGVGMVNAPASAYVIAQPRGVIGVITPWNFPLQLSCVPAINAFAAGNTVMVKMSELTPHLAHQLKKAVADFFSEEEFFILEDEEDGGLGPIFSDKAWDFLIFTGSANTGKRVMQNCAKHLTPLMLELGGKSPCVVHPNYPLDKFVARLIPSKLFNAGQVCIAPDYVFCPHNKVDELLAEIDKTYKKMYPSILQSRDYTSMINAREKQRVLTLSEDVKNNCARFIEFNLADEDLSQTNKLALMVCVNPAADSKVMQEEVFGPILVILSYKNIQEVREHINNNPSPLALYYFDKNKKRAQEFLKTVRFGGASVNDILMHGGVETLPFGGVGNSGFGEYHGEAGFKALSKMKSIFVRGRFNPALWIAPPWDSPLKKKIFEKLTTM